MKSITCKSCGSEIKVNSIKQIECEYCGSLIEVDEITLDDIKFKGNRSNYTEFEHNIQLLRSAIKENDFKNAYKYSKLLLLLDSKNSKLWELTAKYHFFCKAYSYENEDFDLFKKYFKSYESFSDEDSIIFIDLLEKTYKLFYKKYINIEYDKSRSGEIWDSFSDEKIIGMINFFELSKIYFNYYSDYEALKIVVMELSGQNKEFWLYSNDGNVEVKEDFKKFNFDALEFRQCIIDILVSKDNSYIEPEIIYETKYSSSSANGSCFIATLCYNNFNHPNVILLRQFRDKNLSTNVIGKLIIDCYYRLSPNIVNQIKNKNKIILLIKFTILVPVLTLIKIYYGNVWTFERRKIKG